MRQRREDIDFSDAKRRVEKLMGRAIQAKPARTEQRVVESYPYVDEEGRLLYEVVRLEPKSFRHRRPDGRGGLIWSIGGVRRPLYRLPAVLRASEVLVVEGERDVHGLERLGFVATTNSGGASQPWQREWTDNLSGRRVAIIPDADEPGREHGLKIREALLGSADEVLLVNLPPGIKDISDFIGAGHGAADIRTLIEQARQPTR
jgi:hypothetical protein